MQNIFSEKSIFVSFQQMVGINVRLNINWYRIALRMSNISEPKIDQTFCVSFFLFYIKIPLASSLNQLIIPNAMIGFAIGNEMKEKTIIS